MREKSRNYFSVVGGCPLNLQSVTCVGQPDIKGDTHIQGWDMVKGQRSFWGVIHRLKLGRYFCSQIKEFTNLIPVWFLNVIFIKMQITLHIEINH